MKTCWPLILFLFCLKVLPQKSGLPVGVITDSVVVADAAGETYALYLPGSYDGLNSLPVVFVFDPAARGRTAITPFVPAAEKYQYILIGSNNTRNGPYDVNFKVAQRLFNQCLNTYKILPGRIYTAGFSGGARLAATIAILSGAIEGVVGCGAGFAGFPYLPSPRDHYSYAGLVGNLDMNFKEMSGLPEWLDSTGIPVEVFTFEGGHSWPPAEELMRAFDWLQLQAIKKGLVPADDDMILQTYSESYRRARQLETIGALYPALQQYEQIFRNYNTFLKLDSLGARVSTLRQDKDYKREEKEYKRAGQLEDTLSTRYQNRFNRELEEAGTEDGYKWWQRQLRALNQDYLQSKEPQMQHMGERLRSQLLAIAIESFDAQVAGRQPEKAAYCAGLLVHFDPENAYFRYKIAIGFARLNRSDLASEYLIQALECGWADKGVLEHSNELGPLLQVEPVKSLLEKL